MIRLERCVMEIGEHIFVGIVLLTAVFILFVLPVYLLTRGLRSFALRPLERAFIGIELHQEPEPGDVAFTYHTYRGFLLWLTQTEHRVVAPADQARVLLKRLLRFNLTWGMLSYGMLFVPLLSLGNYFAQKRSIDRQLGMTANDNPTD